MITTLLTQLNQLDTTKTFWLAYSGGLDSCVLLHLFSQLKQQQPHLNLRAIHVNHGLSSNASLWAQYCQKNCEDLEIPYQMIQVNASANVGESREAAAREARYQAFTEIMQEGHYLVTAHHLDDQAETLLLRLFRGAGIQGLASMSELRSFAKGFLLRPLLNFSRQQLLDYANEHQLEWIEDESNFDVSYDRNFVRHELLPLIQQRWPSVNAVLGRVAQNCQESLQLLDELAELNLPPPYTSPVAHLLLGDASRGEGTIDDFPPAKRGGVNPELSPPPAKRGGGLGWGALSVSYLLTLSQPKLYNLIRYWLREQNFPSLPRHKLKELHQTVLLAAEDATPILNWGDYEIRRYRDQIYAMPALPHHDPSQIIPWLDLTKPLELPNNLGVLHPHDFAFPKDSQITIRFRQGGERLKISGRAGTHELKKLWQEWGVTPWLRDRIPLLYCNDRLANVVGYCECC